MSAEILKLDREKQKKKLLDQLADMQMGNYVMPRKVSAKIKDLKTEAHFKAKDRL